MKFKVGDYAKPKYFGSYKDCGVYDDHKASYIKITDIKVHYSYDIYNNRGENISHCRVCFDDDNLQPYTPTPAQLEAMRVEEERSTEEPKQTKPQLTYKKE
jgi:hypothetical protein